MTLPCGSCNAALKLSLSGAILSRIQASRALSEMRPCSVNKSTGQNIRDINPRAELPEPTILMKPLP